MLADEAHHFNANTSKSKNENLDLDFKVELKDNASAKDVERLGWEHTVIELILKKNGQSTNNKNALLEFTATLSGDAKVQAKYIDKMIYKFDLKAFLSAGYTKEINLVSSTYEKKERVLLAILFQWYRHRIALKHNIPNFKPVMLFRSKTIAESKQDYEYFLDIVENLTSDDLEFYKELASQIADSDNVNEQGNSRVNQILHFIDANNISNSDIADWIKYNYQERNVIITNSKDGTKTLEKTTDDQERLLNSLEDKDNNIRAIFTVKRLTEGWDVLNLLIL